METLTQQLVPSVGAGQKEGRLIKNASWPRL